MNVKKHIVVRGRLIAVFMLLLSFSIQAQDFYWRGKSGLWSDPANWSSSVGGIPTATDNVVFDANSFSADGQTVLIDKKAECNNMIWTALSNKPLLSGEKSLFIYGNLQLSPKLKIAYTGDIYFEASSEEHTIDLAGLQLQSNLIFEGGAQWNFSGEVNTGDADISLMAGSINTNGKTMVCGSFISMGGQERKLILNSSIVRITGFNGEWRVDNALDFQKGSSKIHILNSNPLSISSFRGGSKNYQQVEFSSNVIVFGSNTFEYLQLNAGISCSLQSGKTQTIKQSLSAQGCSGLITIRATENELAIIKKVNGNIELSFVGLKYIKANMSSGGQFNATYSIDYGNNVGCNITENQRDMVWINGTGNWSDTLHWNALNAGPDSKCVPMPNDNVIFNQNSFSGSDTVNVDLVYSYCNDLIWSSNKNAVLKNQFDSSQIVLSGSLQFAPQMQNQFKGMFSFRSNGGIKTIQSNGVAFAGDVQFGGENGKYELKDALKVKGAIRFQKGRFNSKNNPIDCGQFISDSSFVRNLNLSSTVLKISNAAAQPDFSLNNQNLTFNPNKLQIELFGDEAEMRVFGGDTIWFYQVSFTNPNASVMFRNDSTYSIFKKISFAGNGEIFGSNQFDSIVLSKACVYSLQSGKTQTIRKEIIAPGSCEGTLILKSSRNGKTAKLKMLGDTLLIRHISLRDIKALPQAVYIAKKAVDLGNNLGWTEISGEGKRELFWVDGSGNWNDVAHWSLSSNGAGGECVPTPKDIVHFDRNSFSVMGKIVSVNLSNAFASDLIWEDDVANPVFVADDYKTLRIFGSLELSKNMEFAFAGAVYFESSKPGNTINANGMKFRYLNNSFYFDGVGGEWTLLDNLDLGESDSLRNSINLVNGSLITNNKTISCYSFISGASNNRSLILGNSSINVYNNWLLNGTNMNLQAGTSRIQIESGQFLQKTAQDIAYYDVFFTDERKKQKLILLESDIVRFKSISFQNGELSGQESLMDVEEIEFSGTGSVNTLDSTLLNVYTIGKLVFHDEGEIFGNNSIGEVYFNSTGLIHGNGEFGKAQFADDGNILGSNLFGDLSFAPGHLYQLEGGQQQTISNTFNIRGNNCEPVWLQSTDDLLSGIYKTSDTVYGEFIEMSNIRADGGAVFDAGNYSNNVSNSNMGWVFHDTPLKYQLDSITGSLDDSLFICASNFNVGPATTFLWQKFPDGDTVGTGYCLTIPPHQPGYYTLTVTYNEEGGCVKQDTMLWGCFYAMDIENTDVSCYGFSDGAVDMEITEGTGSRPYEVAWYENEDTIANGLNVGNLPKGIYSYTVTDREGCTDVGTIEVGEPDSISFDFYVDYNQSIIEVEVSGGIHPYTYLWETGAVDYFTEFQEVGEYLVEVTDENNCTKTASVFVDNRFNVLAPNAFTPNGDGLNDNFELFWQGPEIFSYQMDIFSRWGNQVFTTNNFQEHWNGQLFNSGDLQPRGVYSWRVVVTSYDGKQITEQGIVTLLR